MPLLEANESPAEEELTVQPTTAAMVKQFFDVGTSGHQQHIIEVFAPPKAPETQIAAPGKQEPPLVRAMHGLVKHR